MWTNSFYYCKCKECKVDLQQGDRIVIQGKDKYCAECGAELEGADPGDKPVKPRIIDKKKSNM